MAQYWINGAIWDVIYRAPENTKNGRRRKTLGICRVASKRITISPAQSRRQIRITLIHEVLHAEIPEFDEDRIESIAHDLHAVLCGEVLHDR